MDLTDHLVVPVRDLAPVAALLDATGAEVESGWTDPSSRPALRCAGPWGTVLLLVQGGETRWAVLRPDTPVAGEPVEETWQGPYGPVVVRGTRPDGQPLLVLGEPAGWPAGAFRGTLASDVVLPVDDLAGAVAALAAAGVEPAPPFHGIEVPGARYEDGDPRERGATGIGLVAAGPDVRPQLTLAVATEVPDGLWRPGLAGVDLSVHGDVRRYAAASLLPVVAARQAADPASPAPWPDPWGGDEPDEAAYSRCLDPTRYRRVADRAGAWLAELEARGLATVVVEESGGRPGLPDRTDWTSARRVVPTREGALELWVLGAAMTGDRGGPVVPDALTYLAVGDPLVVLTALPDCGCDACDCGSADLDDAVDRRFVHVLSGGLQHASAPYGDLTWTVDGWEGSEDTDRLEAAVAAGDPEVRVVRGEPWL